MAATEVGSSSAPRQPEVAHATAERPWPRLDRDRLHHRANHAVSGVTRVFGSLTAIAIALVVVLLWSLGLAYDTRLERAITSLTTVVTFVMVFIIQSTQNREGRAMQTKLDALLIANDRLNERGLLGLEQRPDATIKDVQVEVHEAGDTDQSDGGVFVRGRADG